MNQVDSAWGSIQGQPLASMHMCPRVHLPTQAYLHTETHVLTQRNIYIHAPSQGILQHAHAHTHTHGNVYLHTNSALVWAAERETYSSRGKPRLILVGYKGRWAQVSRHRTAEVHPSRSRASCGLGWGDEPRGTFMTTPFHSTQALVLDAKLFQRQLQFLSRFCPGSHAVTLSRDGSSCCLFQSSAGQWH